MKQPKLRSLITLATLVSCGIANAVQFEADTTEAHIIVTRPIDVWSSDESAAEKSLEALRAKTANYQLKLSESAYVFSNLVGKSPTHTIGIEVNKRLQENGLDTPRSSLNYARIDYAITLDPATIEEFLNAEQEVYKLAVINHGDPDSLRGKTSAKKFFGGVLALGSMVVAADKFGAEAGAHATLGSGISDSIQKFTYQYKGAVTPAVVDTSKVNLIQYKEIEIRPVKTAFPDQVGQIIIAYKNGKTPEAEQGALIEAITLLLAGSTPEQVTQNREADYKAKKVIWDSCVASGACK